MDKFTIMIGAIHLAKEMKIALIILGVLVAVLGFGWIVYKILTSGWR